MEANKADRTRQMFALVEECLASGQNKKKFCYEKGISEHIYYYWQKKYLQSNKCSHEGFLPVEVKGSAIQSSIEIEYPNGIRVRLGSDVTQQLLRSLITL